MIEKDFIRFKVVWENLTEKYKCPIIQNNFEYPYYRLMETEKLVIYMEGYIMLTH